MWVREVMTAPAVTVEVDTSVRTALRVLDRHGVTSLPVVDRDGELVGIVSEADLVRDSLLPDQRRTVMIHNVTDRPRARRVDEVMTAHPVTVETTTDLAEAVDLMTSTTVKSLPVLDHGKLAGMLSRRDVVRVLARSDERIEAEVGELFRADGVDWLAEVDDGVVTVTGPSDAGERRVAEALVASVAGVVAVQVD